MDDLIVNKKLIVDYLKARKSKALTRKQLNIILELMDHREQRAQLKGFKDGCANIQKNAVARSPTFLNDDTVMALGNICNSNAQLTTALARLIEKETK